MSWFRKTFGQVTFNDRLMARADEEAESLVNKELQFIDDKYKIEATREKLNYLAEVMKARANENK